ncbi:hypothetical protein CEUSTIGMA_g12289.t1 [Chlamydomonas eustigma]|uniref:PPM-type phosphatase domain-containing protein n=1 Tax=Chlamydomonas eustigma TaxID=1157962 RepID=A0A250XP82_9CHLO|nr:hypothetical protein CEUSTIGMA_g12289.t1 [Chlamydomonas eustigma]|eukprot:GAX84868.1 hypothetical protein CEUSTIGMA_g12289.t1 [Chlamydomonas eustigma]
MATVNSCMFSISHATSQCSVKGEDVLLTKSFDKGDIYVICDGHLGVDAANFVRDHIVEEMLSRWPSQLPNWRNRAEVESHAAALQKAVCEAFAQTEIQWLARRHIAGTTLTVVLISGNLVTSANVGDSAAVIDSGETILELTDSHRIQTHTQEKARLEASQCHIAQLGFHLEGPAKPRDPGIGPLRVWPGGLCVSRSIGDLLSGSEIVPLPHIKQVLLPEQGSRIILASDGLWDVLHHRKAVLLVRPLPTSEAASALLSCSAAAGAHKRLINDDTTIIVIDIMPSASSPHTRTSLTKVSTGTELQNPLSQDSPQESSAQSCWMSCFSSTALPEVISSRQASSRKASISSSVNVSSVFQKDLVVLADVDCLEAFPDIRAMVQQASWGLHSQEDLGPSCKLDFALPLPETMLSLGPPHSFTPHGSEVSTSSTLSALRDTKPHCSDNATVMYKDMRAQYSEKVGTMGGVDSYISGTEVKPVLGVADSASSYDKVR